MALRFKTMAVMSVTTLTATAATAALVGPVALDIAAMADVAPADAVADVT